MLFNRSKEVLLSNISQSIPIYILSAITLLLFVIKELHKIFAKFFWSNNEFGRSKHWDE